MVTKIESDEEWKTFRNQAQRENVAYVFMYSASWCGPCKRIWPLFESLAHQLSPSVRFAKVDVDGAASVAQGQQIHSMPTFVAHHSDGTTERCGGANEPQLRALIDRIANAGNSAEKATGNLTSGTASAMASSSVFSEKKQETSADIYDITSDADWDRFVEVVREKKLPLVVEFGVDSDAACQRMKQVFSEAEERFRGKCLFARVHSESAPVANNTFNLSGSVPYYCAYDGDGNGRGHFAGAQKSKFIALVQSATAP